MKSGPNFDENNVLELLTQGDTNAFTEIYNKYWRTLIALAYSHTKDKFLAEEIVQEVFLSLWNKKGAIKINSLSAYLGTAVKFSIFKFHHRETLHSGVKEKIMKSAASAELQDDLFDYKFLQEYVNGIVDQLPEKCRLVYKLSREKEMSVREIAQEMHISEKTVEGHLTKALRVLRLNLKEIMILVFLIRHF